MRRDIQLLRGIAVLVVVIYHSNLNILNYGFLGVDIFFVVSGFLITSIILKGLENNTFTFIQFYLRRAKRLLPALYSTLIFTTILGVFFLTQQEWSDYISQLIAAIGFAENMLLPTQTGYFDQAAEGKPLLHIWSLSLEEQYYFFLPLVLFITPSRFRLYILIFLFSLSLYWCLSWLFSAQQIPPVLWRLSDSHKAEWAFYLFPTRAWELLAGSICAWVMLRRPNIKIPVTVKWVSLSTLVLLCILNLSKQHPSIDALLVVIATSVILLGQDEWLPSKPIFTGIERIGDWSYSIYLVHWPLFAFAYLGFVEQVPMWASVILVPVSFILGFAQYRWVETPFRTGGLRNVFGNGYIVLIVSAVLVAIPVTLTKAKTIQSTDHAYDNSYLFTPSYGLAQKCDSGFDVQSRLTSKCQTDVAPKIIAWGDSYTMHLIRGITKKYNSIAQLTKSACGPILDIAPLHKNKVWAKTCLDFNKQAYDYISQNQHTTHVILSSPFHQYFELGNGQYLSSQGLIDGTFENLTAGLIATINEIKKLGVTPIIVSPPPRSGFNIGGCLDRKINSALLIRKDCQVYVEDYKRHQQNVIKLLTIVEKHASVFWLDKEMCNKHICLTELDGIPLYRDSGHLTNAGSIYALRNFEL